jgi:predicted metal-dependent peptidase
MEAAVLEPKAVPYWNLIKDASIDIKFALISLLNESIRIAVKQKSEKKKKELSAAEIREQKTKEVLAELKKMKTDKTADVSWVREIVKNVPEMDSDVDYDKIKYDYLMEKYG